MNQCKQYCYTCNDGNQYTVHISTGNQKMGEISSVSLPRLITCPSDVPCKNKCYMRAIGARPTVRKTYAENWECYKHFPQWYWFCLNKVCEQQAYFRWHVCGDIPDKNYLWGMVKVAAATSHCKHLCFTKNYKAITDFLDCGGVLPKNLKIVFSRWDGYPCNNKYCMPEAWVEFPNQQLPEYVLARGRRCKHNCSCCNYANEGCWEMKAGDIVILNGSKMKSEETEMDVMRREFEEKFEGY